MLKKLFEFLNFAMSKQPQNQNFYDKIQKTKPCGLKYANTNILQVPREVDSKLLLSILEKNKSCNKLPSNSALSFYASLKKQQENYASRNSNKGQQNDVNFNTKRPSAAYNSTKVKTNRTPVRRNSQKNTKRKYNTSKSIVKQYEDHQGKNLGRLQKKLNELEMEKSNIEKRMKNLDY